MRRPVSILLLLAALAGFWLAGRMNGPLVALRREYRLDQAEPLENLPPLVAFTTVAMGGFRGILADLLWVRASTLQDRGQYFELVQLSDWITKLEPRFASVWAYHAWNLAYNISVLFDDPADRWRWVRHGIVLLRDEGLRYNPGSPQICRELGWLFQHKVGGRYDTAHAYYKRAWAEEMTELLGGGHPDFDALARSPVARKRLAGYRLDPAFMKQVDDAYGPFDWRLPQPHAIYWALEGKKHASGFEAVAADRMVFQSLAESFREGRLFFEPQEDLLVLSPDPDLLPRVRAAYEEAMAEHPDEQTIREAYAYFLRQAVALLYSFNRNQAARELFETVKQKFPGDDTAGGFDMFIYRRFADEVRGLSTAEAARTVEDTIRQSLLCRAVGDDERAAGYDQLARLYWKAARDARKTNPQLRDQPPLPSYARILKTAREQVLGELKSEAARKRLGTSNQ